MAKRKKEEKPGYGKLLDAWIPPQNAGVPVGCIATTFTFDPPLFEEECLGRFLQLESDPVQDGSVYLIEREEKLFKIECASVLVDQYHCRGSRSLRWDMLSARIPGAVMHAKVCFLYWNNLIRVIVTSANITEDGYRRNLEVFTALDFCESYSDITHESLTEIILFLRSLTGFVSKIGTLEDPAVNRWEKLLSKAEHVAMEWNEAGPKLHSKVIVSEPIFVGPGRSDLFSQISTKLTRGGPPYHADVLSPFFDEPGIFNRPVVKLWEILRQRGQADVNFWVNVDESDDSELRYIQAPESLRKTEIRDTAVTTFFKLNTNNRPLHAKAIWLENQKYIQHIIGSSNFTSRGTGLSKAPNIEANIAFTIRIGKDKKLEKQLECCWPEGESFEVNGNCSWLRPVNEDDADKDGLPPLPSGFGAAWYHAHKSGTEVILTIVEPSCQGWRIMDEEEIKLIYSEEQWLAEGSSSEISIPWDSSLKPPSGFIVSWKNSSAVAWWPVNVLSAESLPPPEELRDLSLDTLISILTSARPLHVVLREHLRRKRKIGAKSEKEKREVVDPHRKVDQSSFLLQRTRRMSRALNSLRQRLEQPVATPGSLQWRLGKPVGVMAIKDALLREAKSSDEKAFLLSELALELARVKPNSAKGCLPVSDIRSAINTIIEEIKSSAFDIKCNNTAGLKNYIKRVFKAVRQ